MANALDEILRHRFAERRVAVCVTMLLSRRSLYLERRVMKSKDLIAELTTVQKTYTLNANPTS